MSEWRRMAIEAIPSCQKFIEKAKDPYDMWFQLWDEVDEYLPQPGEVEKTQQIIDFALWCSKDEMSHAFKPERCRYVSETAEIFLSRMIASFVIGGTYLREYLPTRMSQSHFEDCIRALGHAHSEEKVADARKAFHTIKRELK